MKVIDYEWERYMSLKKLERRKTKYNILFKIRDVINESDKKNIEKVTVTFKRTYDEREILAIAGSLHYYWVIDFVIQKEESITLLYRNCRICEKVAPTQLWAEEIAKLSEQGD